MKKGKAEFVVPRTDADTGRAFATTYYLPNDVMTEILPTPAYAGPPLTAPPEYPNWSTGDFTDTVDGHRLRWTDNLGSYGQQLSGTLYVDGVQQYRESYTWSNTESGVALATANYWVYTDGQTALVKMTALVDSMRTIIFSQGPALDLKTCWLALIRFCPSLCGPRTPTVQVARMRGRVCGRRGSGSQLQRRPLPSLPHGPHSMRLARQ